MSGFPIIDLAARAETASEALQGLRGLETQPSLRGEQAEARLGGPGSAGERPRPTGEVGRVFNTLFSELFPTTPSLGGKILPSQRVNIPRTCRVPVGHRDVAWEGAGLKYQLLESEDRQGLNSSGRGASWRLRFSSPTTSF